MTIQYGVGKVALATLAIVLCAGGGNTARAEFAIGDFVTLRQVAWESSTLLDSSQPFSTAFPTALIIGITGETNRYSIILTSGPAVQGYLATGGTNTALTSHHINPTLPYGGLMGGEITALRLNIGFDDAEIFDGTLEVPLGELTLTNLSAYPGLDGMTVRQFAAMADRALGGDATGYSLDNITFITSQLNETFINRVPSDWGQAHLLLPEPLSMAVLLPVVCIALAARRNRSCLKLV